MVIMTRTMIMKKMKKTRKRIVAAMKLRMMEVRVKNLMMVSIFKVC